MIIIHRRSSFLKRLKLILGGPALGLIGLCIIYWGSQEKTLAGTASEQPEEVRLEDLIARGPEGNSHIILTEFETCADCVYQYRKKSKTWEKVWIPIIPKSTEQVVPEDEGKKADVPGRPPAPGTVKAILVSKNVSNEAEMDTKLSNQPRLQGMVTNTIDKLGYSEKKLLGESYRSTDFTKCIIFEEGRTPAGSMKVYLLWAGGAALIIIGIGCFIYGFMPRRVPDAQPVDDIPTVKPADDIPTAEEA